jgi:hypothetical protein
MMLANKTVCYVTEIKVSNSAAAAPCSFPARPKMQRNWLRMMQDYRAGESAGKQIRRKLPATRSLLFRRSQSLPERSSRSSILLFSFCFSLLWSS